MVKKTFSFKIPNNPIVKKLIRGDTALDREILDLKRRQIHDRSFHPEKYTNKSQNKIELTYLQKRKIIRTFGKLSIEMLKLKLSKLSSQDGLIILTVLAEHISKK